MKNIFTIFCAVLLSANAFAQSKAYAPTLVAPADAKENVMVVTLLDWAPIAAFANPRYEIQIADNQNFNNPMELATLETAIETPTLKFNQVYYWRVRALDEQPDQPVSDWSEVRHFTTFSSVNMQLPTNSLQKPQSPNVTMTWLSPDNTRFKGVEGFQIAYATSEDMSNPVYTEVSISDDSTSTMSVKILGLKLNQQYYWNVRAINRAEGAMHDTSNWAEAPFTFIVVNEPVQNKPQMRNNRNVDVDPDVLLELKNDYKDDLIYQFEIALDEEFTNSLGIFDTTAFKFRCPSLRFGQKYYWRARHASGEDVSDWSFTDDQVWWFTVISKPQLKDPANGATVNSRNSLTWSEISTTTKYTLAISKGENFAEDNTKYFELNPSVTTTFAVSLTNLPGFSFETDVLYYWKVKSTHVTYNGEIEDSEWSETRNFKYTSVGINDYDQLSSVVYPNPSNGTITIELQNVDKAIVTIYDLIGNVKFMDEMSFSDGRQTIETNLPKGLYILQVNSNGKLSNKKITIQ